MPPGQPSKRRKVLEASNPETFEEIPNNNPQTDTQNNPGISEPSKHFTSNGNVKCPNCNNTFTLPKFQRRKDFIGQILRSDKKCFQWTGFPSVKQLDNTFKWLLPAARKTKLWNTSRHGRKVSTQKARRSTEMLYHEFLLTLVRIRRGLDTESLAYLFEIAQPHVSRIFITWVNFLHQCLLPLIKWPSKEIVRGNLPKSFKSFPKTRVIIDGTEFFIQKPYRPLAQRQTWSNYKHHNTFKLLVGIMPTGVITFLSKLYTGSISDLHIVKKSKLLDLLESEDDVMADRGFNIRHLLLQKHSTLNIPAFSHGQNLSHKAVRHSRKVANVRIHVERAIRRIKTFKILNGIIPLKLRFCLNQVLVIVSFLCNLQGRLCG